MRLTKLEIGGAFPVRGRTRVKLAIAAGVMLAAAVTMPYAAFSGDEPAKPGDIILQFPSPG